MEAGIQRGGERRGGCIAQRRELQGWGRWAVACVDQPQGRPTLARGVHLLVVSVGGRKGRGAGVEGESLFVTHQDRGWLGWKAGGRGGPREAGPSEPHRLEQRRRHFIFIGSSQAAPVEKLYPAPLRALGARFRGGRET